MKIPKLESIHTRLVSQLRTRGFGYFASVFGVLGVALLLWPFYPDVRGVTAAAAQLIIVLLVALTWGTGPALVASFLSAVYLNFYYVPPTMKFQIRMAAGDDLVALLVYLVTAILVGQLSSRAQQRAREVQKLYDQLSAAFERESQLEGIRRSEQMKSALLDTVTHDLRTPLTSIKAAATALRDVMNTPDGTKPSAAQQEFLSIIVQQSDRLNHFIEGMIELAKLESNHSTGPPASPVPVEEIISAAISRVKEISKSHIFRTDCEDDITALVQPKAVSQVLYSLLENAVRYSPAGSTISVWATRADSDRVLICVEDEGPGIPPAMRPFVFDKFFRALPPDQKKPDGLGLGLAIARGIVEAQRGTITIEDRDNGKPGARIALTFPRVAK